MLSLQALRKPERCGDLPVNVLAVQLKAERPIWPCCHCCGANQTPSHPYSRIQRSPDTDKRPYFSRFNPSVCFCGDFWPLSLKGEFFLTQEIWAKMKLKLWDESTCNSESHAETEIMLSSFSSFLPSLTVGLRSAKEILLCYSHQKVATNPWKKVTQFSLSIEVASTNSRESGFLRFRSTLPK